jgi:endo-1,4-beta-xylanase
MRLDMWSSASLINWTTRAATVCCLLLLGACSHPIEIVGEGDIWSLAGRTCTLENHQEAASTCTENYAVYAYQETYYATPRNGWRFDHWVNYCDTTTANQCTFNVSASDVRKFWFKAVPPLRAVFVPEEAPQTLSQAAADAGIDVGVAIEHNATPDRVSLVQQEFTSITPENAMKWHSLAPAPGVHDFSAADTTVAVADAANLRIRGHTLIWHRLNGQPSWLAGELAASSDPAETLRNLMEEHITAVVGRYAGRISQWDVVNEPLALVGGGFDPNNIFFETLGEEYLDIAFHSAHLADPSASLFLNETFTEFVPAKFDALVALASSLLARGVPLHGIGLQAHFFLQAPDGVLLQQQLARITALGLSVELTELDIPLQLFANQSDPLQAQAIAYGKVFAACLAVPGCTGITVWGVDDADTWLDNFVLTAPNAPNRPLLFDGALNPKPAYYLVRGLLEGH